MRAPSAHMSDERVVGMCVSVDEKLFQSMHFYDAHLHTLLQFIFISFYCFKCWPFVFVFVFFACCALADAIDWFRVRRLCYVARAHAEHFSFLFNLLIIIQEETELNKHTQTHTSHHFVCAFSFFSSSFFVHKLKIGFLFATQATHTFRFLSALFVRKEK